VLVYSTKLGKPITIVSETAGINGLVYTEHEVNLLKDKDAHSIHLRVVDECKRLFNGRVVR